MFWFNQDDVRDQLAATLKDGLDRLIVDTTIDNKALRPVTASPARVNRWNQWREALIF